MVYHIYTVVGGVQKNCTDLTLTLFNEKELSSKNFVRVKTYLASKVLNNS